ncbi:Bug family tripartite tricarboxylate transporter substrate binding protein [Falsiroseomonas bella]|uniref:Bug family tripartite tricarboxylate transporter substrate binding protein n=1 Tax=Falsiroseomonas bella TaxID=2184016 RepID=UPI001304B213|nr:tripartite tricarboxylate transporter substrate binding protein [Falsiroseomonas bella]
MAPFPPGGSVDLVARIVQPKVAELLGGAVVVENRGGAGGMLGSEQVARSAPDGSTVVWGNIATHALNAAVYTRMPYDPVADFAPVTLAAQVEFMLAVHPSVPARTVAELVALAKAEPGKLNYGTAGAGSLPHLLTEMLKRAGGGLQIEHVPYRGGGPMLVDLQAGHISMTIADVANILPLLQAGRLRGIAVAGAERSAVLPDLPTIAETLPGVVGTAWHGIFAPARTPADTVKRLNAAFVGAVRDADVQQRMRAAGTVPVGSTPEELADFQRAEITKWTEIARAVGAKVE